MSLGCELSLFEGNNCFQKIFTSFQSLNNLCLSIRNVRNYWKEVCLCDCFLNGLSFLVNCFSLQLWKITYWIKVAVETCVSVSAQFHCFWSSMLLPVVTWITVKEANQKSRCCWCSTQAWIWKQEVCCRVATSGTSLQWRKGSTFFVCHTCTASVKCGIAAC